MDLVEGEYHIDLQKNDEPVIQSPRKVPLSLMPKLKETLDNLTISGVVRKLERPTDWVRAVASTLSLGGGVPTQNFRTGSNLS